MPASVQSGAERWSDDRRRLHLPYKPFPKQEEFHHSPAKYRLFGGAAGPGKSHALLMEAVLQAHDHHGVNTLLLRRTFPELEGSLLLYFRREVPRELYRSFNEAKHTVTWLNGSTTRFGYSHGENDIYQYQGAEFLFIGIDELTHFTLRQWQFLTSRNRCPVRGAFANMAATANPGNIGHAWVKALWIDKEPAAGMSSPGEYDPADYEFIAARVWDNPIYAHDGNYFKSLRALPDGLRKMFLDGDWNAFAGQYFSNFNPERHVVRAEQIGAQTWSPRWISIDWGFEHPAAVYWHVSLPGQGTLAGGGTRSRVATYRELVCQHVAPRALAEQIVARSLASSSAHREEIDAMYLSPDAFARRTDEATIAEQMGDVFAAHGFPRPIPADNDRVGGWMLMYQMLDAGDWAIADGCPELIRTLPSLVRDAARVEDIEKIDGDDPADAARYGLKSRFRPSHLGRPPLEERLAARVTSADPTVRAIQARKAMLDEQHRTAPVFPRRWAPRFKQ